MTRKDFVKIISILKTAYPNKKMIETDAEMEVWYRILGDIDKNDLERATIKAVTTLVFPPSIAELRLLATEGDKPKDWGEGWDLVRRAVSRFGSYRPQEAIEWISTQDQLAGQIAQRLGFRDICLAENLEYVRANFRMMYENTKEIETRQRAMPQQLRYQGENEMLDEPNRSEELNEKIAALNF